MTFLARAHRPLARRLAAIRFQLKYGGRLISRIDPDDDLLHWALDAASAEDSFRYFRAVQAYFEGGERNTAELEAVLGEVDCSLDEADSVLEFACGSGRLTRHLVRRMSPTRLAVSDIDRRAVDFVRRAFGVEGFYSASDPEKLVHDCRYDLILVVSLFSHLPTQTWTRWLTRLDEMLEPDGVLVLSTLPWDPDVAQIPDEQKEAFELGFLYSERNETRGRLEDREYGTAFVRKEFVTQAVSQHFRGRLVKYFPRALNGVQDVYILQRGGAQAAIYAPEARC